MKISVKSLFESSLIDYFKQLAKMMGDGPQGDFWNWKVKQAHQVNLVKIETIRKQYPQVDKYLKGKPEINFKECYGNSGKMALYVEGVEYVEGEISYHGVPIEHAWNKIDGKYFDITKDTLFSTNSDYQEYVAVIELKYAQLAKYIFKYKHWGGWIYEEFETQTKGAPIIASKRRKMMMESINESPDLLKYKKEMHGFRDADAYSFTSDIDAKNNIKVQIGAPSLSHYEARLYGMYNGRLFLNAKIISFWKHPEKYLLSRIIKEIENQLHIKILNNDWRVETYGEINKDYYDAFDIDYEYRRNLDNAKYPLIDDYIKGSIQSDDAPEEEYQEHIKSPLLKKSKDVLPGFGSKNPKAESRFKEKMNAPFESFYPKLNESPDEFEVDGHYYNSLGAGTYPFVVVYNLMNDEFIKVELSDKEGILHDEANMAPGNASRNRFYAYPGRLYKEAKVITFWTHPNKEELIEILHSFKEDYDIDMLTHEWRIEVYSEGVTGELCYGADETDRAGEISYPFIEDYLEGDIESTNPSEEEHEEHMKSPLLKKSKKIPIGFGSKHPNAELRFKEKMDAPFESLDESDVKDAYYERKFGIKREIHEIPVFEKDIVAKVEDDQLNEIPIFKNPKDFNGYDDNVRAIADEKGNLYVAMQNRLFNHGMMGNALLDAKEIKTKRFYSMGKTVGETRGIYMDQTHFLLLNRVGNTDTFTTSDIFSWEGGETERMIHNLKQKNPQFKYIFPEYNEELVESLYPRLFETPDQIKKEGSDFENEEGDSEWDVIEWSVEGTRPFGYYLDKFYIGGYGYKHSNIFTEFGVGVYRSDFSFPGRIWTKEKLISFWQFPNKEQFKKFTNDLKEATDIDILNDSEYKIEIIKNGNEEAGYVGGIWYPADYETPIIDFVTAKEYIGSEQRSKEENEIEHIKSPLLKKSKIVPTGFGSKNPKAEQRFKEKLEKPFEAVKDVYYPALLESPDHVYLPEDEYPTWWYRLGPAYAFGYYQGKFYVSKNHGVHGFMGISAIDELDIDRPNYKFPGRLWPDIKLLSFWIYPDKEEFKKITQHLKEEGFDITEPFWKVEILKNKTTNDIEKDGKISYDDHNGVWTKKDNDEYVVNWVSPQDYMGSEQLTDEQRNVQHNLSPLLKKSGFVPLGFGSKHPKAEKRFKEKIEQPFESIDDVSNDKLFETPDRLWFDGWNIEYHDERALPFSVTLDNQNNVLDVMIGSAGLSHSQANVNRNPNAHLHQGYHGRLYFIDPSVITFWQYPQHKSDLYKIIKMIEKHINQDMFGKNWKIEINDEDYNPVFVSLDDYLKNEIQSNDASEEDYLEHLKSPLLKKSKEVPIGFGSKNPKAEQRFKEKINAPFESFYPRLNESPDHVVLPNGSMKRWHDGINFSFGFFNDKFYFSSEGQIHGDIEISNQKDGWSPRRGFLYPGRIWPDDKILSFWVYPDKAHFKIIIDELEMHGINILEPGWNVEILVEDDDKTIPTDSFLDDDGPNNGAWRGVFDNNKYGVTHIHPSKYNGSGQRSEEETEIEHIKSPLLKKSKSVPLGFGSKHPKAEELAKEKRNQPFESAE